MEKLKPCPFCGGKGKVSYKDYLFGGWNGKSDSRRKYRVQVICNKCRARGKPVITDWIVNHSPYQTTYWDKDSRNEEATKAFMPYIVQAIKAWNRRAEMSFSPAMPITNADRIREMSDDELAILFGDACACHYDDADVCEKWGGACDRCWLDWLKQEVSDAELD